MFDFVEVKQANWVCENGSVQNMDLQSGPPFFIEQQLSKLSKWWAVSSFKWF